MLDDLVCEELTFPGIYRGIVADNNDPEGMLRIRARIPRVLAETYSCWALPCLFSQPSGPPPVGAPVWVMFEGGDVNWPVWMGQWLTPEQTAAPPSTNYMTTDTKQSVLAEKDFSVAPTVPDPTAALNPINLEYLNAANYLTQAAAAATYLPLTSYNPGTFTENDQSGSGAVTIPRASGGVQQYTMTGNVTSCTVTGAAKGQLMVLRLKQDTTGGRTWTWFTNVTWGPRGAPLVPTGANQQATYTFEYDGTNWVEVSRTPVDTGWITATLQNAWVAGTGADGAPAYRRVESTVYIRGNVRSGVLGTTAFTLPTGFQPASELDMPTTANHAFGDMRILSSGAVVPVTGSVTDFFRLNCSFLVG